MIDYRKELERNLNDIEKLISTPNLIRDTILISLRAVDFKTLYQAQRTKLDNAIKSIENIHSGSMAKAYQIIYNQVCILAVSALSVNLEKYFLNSVMSNVKNVNIKDENKIKLTLAELKEYNFNIKGNIGNIILKKDNSINFQDLQSTIRAFEDYLGKQFSIDDDVKRKIIFYQQTRHILVHKDGKIDNEFLKKTSFLDSNIKKYIKDDNIQLNEKDWLDLKASFLDLFTSITKQT